MYTTLKIYSAFGQFGSVTYFVDVSLLQNDFFFLENFFWFTPCKFQFFTRHATRLGSRKVMFHSINKPPERNEGKKACLPILCTSAILIKM